MKKAKQIIAVLLAGTFAALLIGCGGDPVKPAGPGGIRHQPYSPGNGQYK